tara:strand:- start:166 stop:942 length:777 start_codon:yes stop_codon:yes gene_type:complete
MDFKKSKLFISLPCYDAMVTMQTMMSVMYLSNLLNSHGIVFTIDFIGNESLIPRARNNSLGRFMKTDFTHLLFIDSDIEFEAEAVIDLLKSNKDVACCAYPRKAYNFNRLMYSLEFENGSKEKLESRGLDFTYNALYDINNKLITDGNYIKVRHASTGFMMVQRPILEKLYKKHTELSIITDNMSQSDEKIVGLFCCMIKNLQYLSEDYSFCERVIDEGGSVWINTNYNLNHIGKNVFRSDIKNRKTLGRSQAERVFY